jgi:dipeptidase E
MQTTNDMPIDLVPSFDTFGIVPFQINPHYYPGGIWWKEEEMEGFNQHFGETRLRRIDEFHQHNKTAVIGLYEGSFLRCNEEGIELLGNKAVIVRKNKENKTILENQKLNYDLSTR